MSTLRDVKYITDVMIQVGDIISTLNGDVQCVREIS